ncbi:FtsX-like permease family protein [Rariglobus hedericola]|uniref:FtsX-like permease family protein n=2 Tax=Rariglobus hedericola TaxID=2597822 RepID=A0A556QQW5_9BACT|nr:FtsX-like permease family protein [Rariglobus hedericola]
MPMRTPLAWLNTIQNKKRTATAVGGICFAVLLIFMQAGFLGAARLNSSLTYRQLDFNLMIVSRGYLMLTRSESIDIYRVIQARSVPGVASVEGLLLEGGRWSNQVSNSSESCFIFGLRPGGHYFLDPALNDSIGLLNERQTVLVDRLARSSYGPWHTGGPAIVNRQELSIRGDYALGMGLLADGSVITSLDTYLRLYGIPQLREYQFGLVRTAPGADVNAVATALREALPRDVLVLTKPDLIEREENYFVNVKPVGVMFQVGMFVAFLVGAVILYQILSSEIANRLREFATLKAMGYTERYIYAVGIRQGLIFSLMGYFPSLILSFGLYRLLRALSSFPVYMDLTRALFVLGLTLAMCAIAAVFALGKIKRADPADLF